MSKLRHEYSINTVITRSIPLNKQLKRYYIKKYTKMVKCNGPEYAADIFKTARDVLLGYRADPNRISRRETWLARMPFKINGWLVSLFHYMDTDPHNTINFVKLYCGVSEPLVSADESADSFHRVLNEIEERATHMENTPTFLLRWLRMLSSSQTKKMKAYFGIKKQPHHPYHRYVIFHSLEEWMTYWRKWYALLKGRTIRIPSLESYVKTHAPIPEMYKDFTEGRSESFDRDFAAFTDAMVAHFKGVKPMVELKLVQWVGEALGPDVIFSSLHKARDPHATIADQVVGEVHHIPKSGTVGRRPIAVPNRFLQLGTLPIAEGLNKILRRLPKDSTFDQGRFINYSQARIDKGHYVGSVDLSKATDNLPLSWFQEILKHIPIEWDRNAINSWEVFLQIARGNWKNGQNYSAWTVGQPLGTQPSFPILGLTHNLVLESLALQEGYGHSPYSVLGDDVLITKERLRESYIQQLTSRRIPLSLHKSYEHNLSEFAGVLLVKNQKPRYTSDHKVVTFNNLFDYQNATKVKIPYDHLPKQVKHRIRSVSVNTGLNGRQLYTLLQEMQGLTDVLSPKGEDVASRFFYHLAKELQSAQPTHFSSTVPFQDTVIAYRVSHIERKLDKLPEWYERKFRPAPTDALVNSLIHAVRDLKE